MMGARQSAPQAGVWLEQVAGTALPGANLLEGLENTHMLTLHPCLGCVTPHKDSQWQPVTSPQYRAALVFD